MLPFLSLLGIFLSVILLIYNARKYTASVYLGLFFLFTSLYGLYQYILLYSKSVTLISLFQFNLSIAVSPVYLIGPMLYLYVRSVLTDQSKLERKDIWHFLPMMAYFFSALPNAFIPWQDKVEVARNVVQNQEYMVIYKATLLSEFFPAVLMFIFRLILVLGYTIWSFILFIRYITQKKSSAVLSKQQFMRKWLFNLLFFTLVLVITQIFLVLKSFEMHFSELFFTFNILRVISVTGLIGLLISPFFYPSILYGLPQIPSSDIPGKPDPDPLKQQKAADGRPVLNLESDYLNQIYQKTESFMTENQPYLRSDFNLLQLSVHIQVPAHHLGYYFREIRKQSFNDYRNEWRINHAKKLIGEGKAGDMTLEAIGLLSGFSSRNAFISDFKKFEGESPGSYASRIN